MQTAPQWFIMKKNIRIYREIQMNHDELTRIFRDPPEIETPRLTLRRMLKSDSADMYEYSRDPAVSAYLLWKPHESEAFTRR